MRLGPKDLGHSSKQVLGGVLVCEEAAFARFECLEYTERGREHGLETRVAPSQLRFRHTAEYRQMLAVASIVRDDFADELFLPNYAHIVEV